MALELALAVAVTTVGKPLDRVFRLLGEQGAGDFRHLIRPGGLGGLGRTASRLNDRAEDLAVRLAALPAALRVAIDARITEGGPLRLRLSDLNDIRLALFLFSVATEIAAAFLPLYARAAERPDWLSPDIAAVAPLVLYLVAVAALSPFGGALARQFGARRLFLASVPPTALALVLRITDGPGRGVAALRLLERVGAMLGLATSAVVLGEIGPETSIRMLGLVVLTGGMIYAIVELAGHARRA
jgi:hypothetical protein